MPNRSLRAVSKAYRHEVLSERCDAGGRYAFDTALRLRARFGIWEEHLVPNLIPQAIGIFVFLLFLSDCC